MPIAGLKRHCIRNESTANVFAFFGGVSFLGVIWVAIDFQEPIMNWVRANPLVHGMTLGIGAVVGSLIIFGLLYLGFAEHTEDHKRCAHAFRGRGKPLFPGLHHHIGHLGMNPRWRSPKHHRRH
ncbi:MAG: hypothetical protein HQL33_00955 [Alphaproteobacteria bacterium]|nr:hypothetical protein [Alphaproteobacteria bacterium]